MDGYFFGAVPEVDTVRWNDRKNQTTDLLFARERRLNMEST